MLSTKKTTLRNAGVVIGIALLLVVAIAGCGGGSESSEGVSDEYPPPNVDVTSTTPPGNGSVDQVTWDLPYGEPASLDPLNAWDLPSNTVLSNMCDQLLRVNPDLKIVPGLASSFSQPDASTTVLTIRKGVKFWDGSPMTVDDVLYSLKRQANPKNGSYYGVVTSYISSVKQTGPDQVTVKTNPPLQLMEGYLATGIGTVIQAKYAELKGSQYGTPQGGVMCTGPFELNSWQSGQQITMTRNPNYWDHSLEPEVQNFTFKFVTDPAAITNGLLTGELDGSYEVPLQGIDQLQNSGAGQVYYGKNLTPINVVDLQPSGPYSDINIRRALSLALDRAGIAQTVYKGLASPSSWPQTQDQFGYATDVWLNGLKSIQLSPTPEPAAAKKALARAGTPSRPIVIAVQTGDTATVNTALAVKSAASEIGLPVAVKQLQPAEFINLIFSTSARKGIDAYIGSNDYSDFADPMLMLLYNAYSKSALNWLDYSNPVVDENFVKGEATLDDAERARYGVKALHIYYKTLNKIPVVQYPQRMFMSNEITGAPPDQSTYLYYPWAAAIGAK